jgi:sialate O-acetylesterase
LEGILLHWRTSDWIMPWCRERADKNLSLATDPLQRHPFEPTYNYEAGIETLRQLPIRGVLWYQGESNTHNPELYAQLYPGLVESWRKLWGRQLPFLSVQIAGMNRPSWPEFRLTQLRLAESVPESYLTVSSDLGEAEQVHYRRKFPVGQRLALLALEKVYALPGVEGESPVAVRAERQGAVVRIHFRNTGGVLRSVDGGLLRGFVVRDRQGNWHPVEASIDGDQVELKGQGLETMEEVAYGWEPLPQGSLLNRAGLPTSTFRLPVVDR